jgi:hypothetical protein
MIAAIPIMICVLAAGPPQEQQGTGKLTIQQDQEKLPQLVVRPLGTKAVEKTSIQPEVWAAIITSTALVIGAVVGVWAAVRK